MLGKTFLSLHHFYKPIGMHETCLVSPKEMLLKSLVEPIKMPVTFEKTQLYETVSKRTYSMTLSLR